GKPYQHHRGHKLSKIQAITAAEREILWRCAATFDDLPAEEPQPKNSGKLAASADGDLRPGDDYNARGPAWPELLEPAGWVAVHQGRGRVFWRRPGKDDPGWSATTGLRSKNGTELLCVFSSNAHPFPGPTGGRSCSNHSRFDVFARLHHGG